jgi:hypothetical protein
MVKLKFGDEVIIAKIHASFTSFDTSVDAMKKLKFQGVSDAVIQAMITAKDSFPSGQQGQQTQPQSNISMTNETVVKLVGEGSGDSVIASNIQQVYLQGSCRFDLSPAATISLHRAGVSDYIVQVMAGMSTYSNLIAGKYARPGASPTDPNALPTDSWRGLVLDQTSVVDAIAKLGPPERDVSGQFMEYFNIGFRSTPEAERANFRMLVYKSDKNLRNPSLEGVKTVKLFFLQDKLSEISVEPIQKIDPNTLENLYGQTYFRPSGEFSGFAGGHLDHYYLFAEAPRSFICARVEKGSMLHGLLPRFYNTNGGYREGDIRVIGLLSKSLLSAASNKALQ